MGQWQGSTVHAKSSTCMASAGAGVTDLPCVSSEKFRERGQARISAQQGGPKANGFLDSTKKERS